MRRNLNVVAALVLTVSACTPLAYRQDPKTWDPDYTPPPACDESSTPPCESGKPSAATLVRQAHALGACGQWTGESLSAPRGGLGMAECLLHASCPSVFSTYRKEPTWE